MGRSGHTTISVWSEELACDMLRNVLGIEPKGKAQSVSVTNKEWAQEIVVTTSKGEHFLIIRTGPDEDPWSIVDERFPKHEIELIKGSYSHKLVLLREANQLRKVARRARARHEEEYGLSTNHRYLVADASKA